MFKKPHKPIKRHQLQSFFLKKSEKEKFGGRASGGVYRDLRNGKDYMLKQIINAVDKNMVNERSWDEILAAKILKHAGVLVPKMCAVEDESGSVYVGSSMLPNASNCNADYFKKLPKASRQAVYTSLILHCWLGNRDLVNTDGENFMVDVNNRVYQIDLGNCLFSGFRTLINQPDKFNFNSDSILPFLVKSDNPQFGVITYADNKKTTSLNTTHIHNFFAEMLANPALERAAHLQGSLLLSKFSDQDIEDLVNETGHTKEAKLQRIQTLKARKEALLHYMQDLYGKQALLEEQMALELQRVCHKFGLFDDTIAKPRGDAIMSFTAQFTNALKPKVTLHEKGTISIETSALNAIHPLIKRLSKGQLSQEGAVLNIHLPLPEFRAALHQELIANSFQIFFSSYGYQSNQQDLFHHYAYKGDGSDGFRPEILIEGDTLSLSLPKGADAQKLRQQMIEVFDFDPQFILVEQQSIRLSQTSLETVASGLLEHSGLRKTAVVSENEKGQILAGKLDLAKKGVSGFATAGGNSDYPYNPHRAAREEGMEEFGYSIRDDAALIPIGSTLDNKKKNIFLVPAGGTSAQADTLIPYKEFEDESIRYYSFSEFREAYAKHQIKFDRPSVDIYLRYYQREIQKVLKELKINNVLVYVSKNSKNLGQILLKPSLNEAMYNKEQTLSIDAQSQALIKELLGTENVSVLIKQSRQAQAKAQNPLIINRSCLQINPNLNPAEVYQTLVKKLQAANPIPKNPKTEIGTQTSPITTILINQTPSENPVSTPGAEPLNPFEDLRTTLINKIDNYLNWRANKKLDDGRNYPLGFFTKIRHARKFGKVRADNLKKALELSEDLVELIQTLQEHFAHHSRLHNHSLDTYLLEGIMQHKTLLKIAPDFDLRKAQQRHELREFLCLPQVNLKGQQS